MIVVTRLLFWSDGFTLSPSIIILHPRNRHDVGLIEHERVHQRQMRQDGLIRFWLRYAFSRRWRALYEVEAYRVSIKWGMVANQAARFLSENYMLRISESQALELLRD